MGNPTDNFHGKTISFLIENFAAIAHIEEQEGIELVDPCKFHDWKHLCKQSDMMVR